MKGEGASDEMSAWTGLTVTGCGERLGGWDLCSGRAQQEAGGTWGFAFFDLSGCAEPSSHTWALWGGTQALSGSMWVLVP